MTTPLWDLLNVPSAVDPSRPILKSKDQESTLRVLSDVAMHIAKSIKPRSRIALLDVNTHPSVALIYAAFRANCSLTLLNYRVKPHELAALLNEAEVDRLFVGSRYAETTKHTATLWDGAVRLVDDPDMAIYRGRRIRAPHTPASGFLPVPAQVDPNKAAGEIVLFTSGTTGDPKPIRLSGTALASYVFKTTPLCPTDTQSETMLLSMPLYHIAGIVTLMRSVFAGRRVLLHEQFDEEHWLEAIDLESVTHSFLVPTMLYRIINSEGFEQADLSSLQSITYGGGPMPHSTIEEALERFPKHVQFVSAYGLTEAGGTVTILDANDHARARTYPEWRERLRSLGRPVDDVTITIRSSDGRELPPGQVGQVQVGGPRVEFLTDGGRIDTGDLGRLDTDGYLFLEGRGDEVVVRGGENINTLEIEEVLRLYPPVRDCAVIGLPDEVWGEKLVAVIVSGDDFSEEAMIQMCRTKLAGYKVPDEVHLIPELPTSGAGKVMKRVLRKQLSSVPSMNESSIHD